MAASSIKAATDLISELRSKSSVVGPDSITIDPFFEEDPKNAKIVEFAIKRRKNLLMVGPTGSGKSSLAINVAARLKERLEVVNLHGETNKDEVIGKLLITTNKEGHAQTSTAYGPAVRAYREGCGLLLEEVGMASPDILACLQRFMEIQSGFITLDIGVQETIKRHRDFFVIGTSNDTGWGEESFMYSGIKPMNQSFMNRFSLTALCDYLDPIRETKVVSAKTGIDKAIAAKLVRVAGEVRKARSAATDRVVAVLSTRELLEWADAITGMCLRPLEAAECAFLNRCPEAERPIIARFIQNVFGS